nr:TPA_inf: conotoxin precursor H [Conus ebraeus]
MRTSGRLLLLCLAVGLLLESQAHPIGDDGDSTRNVGSDGTSVEQSKILKRGQDSSAKKAQKKATAYGYYYYEPFPTNGGIPDF